MTPEELKRVLDQTQRDRDHWRAGHAILKVSEENLKREVDTLQRQVSALLFCSDKDKTLVAQQWRELRDLREELHVMSRRVSDIRQVAEEVARLVESSGVEVPEFLKELLK